MPKSGLFLVVSLGILALIIIYSGRVNTSFILFNQPTSMPEKESAMKVLQIDVKVLTQPVRLSGPCMIEVRITNESPQSVLLNKRLSVGYKDSLSRELFIEVFEKGSNEVVSNEALLYERAFSSPDDYVRVEPEQSISTSFNLFEWYRLRSPGEYEIVVHYHAEEELAPKPADLLSGIFSSGRIPLQVIP
jgi:hypothetical protein